MSEAVETEQTPTILEAIRGVVADLGAVSKDGYNESQRFSFRSIEGTVAAVRPLLLQYGITMLPTFESLDQFDYVKDDGRVSHRAIVRGLFKFVGPAGDDVTVVTIGEAVDIEGRATNKATSAATKLCLLRLFQIGGGDEGDVEDHVPAVTSPRAPVARPAASAPAASGQATLRERVNTGAGRTPASGGGASGAPGGITIPQGKKIYAVRMALGWDSQRLLDEIELVCGVSVATDKDLTKGQASSLIEALEQRQNAANQEPPAGDEGYEEF